MKRKAHNKHPDESSSTGFKCMNSGCDQWVSELFLDPETSEKESKMQQFVCAKCLKKIKRRARKCVNVPVKNKAEINVQTENQKPPKTRFWNFLRAKLAAKK